MFRHKCLNLIMYEYTPVFIYRNLRYKDRVVYSVKNTRTGLVDGHTRNIVLTNVTFKVSQAGRQRVLREKKKYVHAGVVGVVNISNEPDLKEYTKVTYNPYLYEGFVRCDNGETVRTAESVIINESGVYAKL